MLSALILGVPCALILLAFGLAQLPPKLPTFSPDELASSACYWSRTNRHGEFMLPKFAIVTEFQVKEKRIFYLKGRTT